MSASNQTKIFFGTLENPVLPEIADRWSQTKPDWKQVHQTRCVEVSSAGESIGETDAMYTRETGQPIGVVTADCVPVILAGKDWVASIHSGWRGTMGEIIKASLDSISPKDTRSVNAWIGPHIGACCYEVSQELADEFAKKFAPFDPSTFIHNDRHLDLGSLCRSQLQAAGIEKIDSINECTRCFKENGKYKYHSYRRDPGVGRQLSIVVRE